jgi:hypothetical protein
MYRRHRELGDAQELPRPTRAALDEDELVHPGHLEKGRRVCRVDHLIPRERDFVQQAVEVSLRLRAQIQLRLLDQLGNDARRPLLRRAKDVGDRFEFPEQQVGEPLKRRLPQFVLVSAESPDHLVAPSAESCESQQAL